MKYSLFIDDIRTPKKARNKAPWLIARNMMEALLIIAENGMPEHISFDHKLGAGECSIAIAKKIISADQRHIEKHGESLLPNSFTCCVHSSSCYNNKVVLRLMANHVITTRRRNTKTH